MRIHLRSTRLLTILLILSLCLVTRAIAEPVSSSPHALVSERVVLMATTSAPQGLTNSAKACEIAKDLALARIGSTLIDLRVVERKKTMRFPSQFTCQWNHARYAYEAVLSIELPSLDGLGNLTSDHLY